MLTFDNYVSYNVSETYTQYITLVPHDVSNILFYTLYTYTPITPITTRSSGVGKNNDAAWFLDTSPRSFSIVRTFSKKASKTREIF